MKIKPIFDNILTTLQKEYSQSDIGLLSGKSGLLLLFGHLYKNNPTQYSQIVDGMLEELFQGIQESNHSFIMSLGIPGAAYAINYLQILEGFDPETDALGDIDSYIHQAIDQEIELNNWDPLHGYIGQGLYLLQRHSFINQTIPLSKIVNALVNSRVEVENHKIWITKGYMNFSNDNYNFGMAHGMAGIVSFLSQVANQGIEKELCKEMITDCFDFFLANEIQNASYMFPQSIEVENGKPTGRGRLAWCYGDLCVANAFFHSSKAFDNDTWYQKGLEIALHTTNVKFEDSYIIDPMICHGSAGVMLQYHRFYKLTGDEKFKKALEYHQGILMDTYHKKNVGIGGFQYSTFVEDKLEYKDEVGILEGSAGIALVLLTIEQDLKDWDLFLMTNV